MATSYHQIMMNHPASSTRFIPADCGSHLAPCHNPPARGTLQDSVGRAGRGPHELDLG